MPSISEAEEPTPQRGNLTMQAKASEKHYSGPTLVVGWPHLIDPKPTTKPKNDDQSVSLIPEKNAPEMHRWAFFQGAKKGAFQLPKSFIIKEVPRLGFEPRTN